jgi:hypothetical protein
MVLEEASGGTDCVRWSDKEEGFLIVGYYAGDGTSASKNPLHFYIDENEERKSFLGGVQLQNKFNKVPKGAYFELVHLGMKPNPNGGKDFRDFDLKFDKENIHPSFKK